MNNLLPDHFENLFLLKRQVHNYNTRRANEFYIATPRTNLRQFSIKYQGPLLYNNLNNNIINSVSYSSFTKKIKRISARLIPQLINKTKFYSYNYH